MLLQIKLKQISKPEKAPFCCDHCENKSVQGLESLELLRHIGSLMTLSFAEFQLIKRT